MVCRAMGSTWTAYGLHFSCFIFLIFVLEVHGCCTLNSEGLALLQFRVKVDVDPYGALANWNPEDCDPCMWSGIECLDGNVVKVNLSGCDLEGVLAPELGDLTRLRFLGLSKNHLSGTIPPHFGQLATVEVLDLRDNNLSGTVPAELEGLHSLKRLLLCNNRFEGSIPVEIGKLSLLSDFQFDDILSTAAAAGIHCINRKFGQPDWHRVLKQSKKSHLFKLPCKWRITPYLNLVRKVMLGSRSSHNHMDDSCSSQAGVISDMHKSVNNVRRVLVEQPANLAVLSSNVNVGAPAPSETVDYLPSRSSGSSPAISNKKKPSPAPAPAPAPASSPTSAQENKPHDTTNAVSHPNDKKSLDAGNSGNSLKLIIGISSAVFLLIVAGVIFFIFRSRAAKIIGPWKTGLSGQLQKAFITGVPKLNGAELETACEDFSNIICIHDGVATLYKGTLSGGVEIAVVSTAIDSIRKWSKHAELVFRKKIDGLSQVNHKNFVNLIGYCEEDEPFTRMMVFEYAPNGTLFEHLHVKELEHLDWSARMRIIMGIAYCLQHMHDLNPPVAHVNLTSKEIFLTDDYAAKIADVHFWAELIANSKNPTEKESKNSERSPLADVERNIHSFGILMLEIISGVLPFSEEQGDLLNWADHYLNDKSVISHLIDPTLDSFKDGELEAVCEVIRSCIQQDPKQRPSMKEVVEKLREALIISPDAAFPRLSPLWWAELEIPSTEAA